jgi:hypothetical protein
MNIISTALSKGTSQKGVVSSKNEERRISGMANTKQTSKSIASKASKILRDGRYSANSKSVAGSALAQTKKGK